MDLILIQKRNIVLISSAFSDQPYTCANDLWLAFPSYACVVACDNRLNVTRAAVTDLNCVPIEILCNLLPIGKCLFKINRRFVFILSNIDLLIFPESLFAGLMSRHFGLFSKFSSGSLREFSS